MTAAVEQLAGERWEASEALECVVVVEGTNAPVAVMGTPDEDPRPEDWQRLHLVVAAPELLAACKDMLRAYADGPQAPRSRPLIDRCRAAIAKAEGRSIAAPMPPAGDAA